jgi:DNA-binding NarL/FixJ family response regulator
VDIDLGAESGFEVAWLIANRAPVRVIMISGHAEHDFAELIAESPAAGFISKSDLSAQAIHHVLGCGEDGAGPAAPSG